MYVDACHHTTTVAKCIARLWAVASCGTCVDDFVTIAAIGRMCVMSGDTRACYEALSIPWVDPKRDWAAASFALRDVVYPDVKQTLANAAAEALLHEESLLQEEALLHAQTVSMRRRRPSRKKKKNKDVVATPEVAAPKEEDESPKEEDDDTSPLFSCLACPITCERMTDPVVLNDGHTYERAAIVAWMARSDRSPLTNTILEPAFMVPNYALRAILATL